MRRSGPLALAGLALLVLVKACNSSEGGTATPGASTTTSAAGPTSTKATSTRPREIKLDGQDPCQLLTQEQLSALKFDPAWPIRGRSDIQLEVVGGDAHVEAPDRLGQRASGQHPGRVAHEDLQQEELGPGQVERPPAPPRLEPHACCWARTVSRSWPVADGAVRGQAQAYRTTRARRISSSTMPRP